MAGIARVVVDIALDREFDYLVPDQLCAAVRIGSRVLVPFRRSEITGYVVGLADRSERTDLKSVLSVCGDKPYIDDQMLKLARWMGDYYCAPVEQALRAVLPGSVRRRDARFKQRLYVRPAEAGVDEETAGARLASRSPKQRAVLDLLARRGGMFLHELIAELGITAAPVRALAKKGRVRLEPGTVPRDPLARRTILPGAPLTLMADQAAALAEICKAADTLQPPVVLLHGVTGSGKTEVYLQAIEHVRGRDRGAIVLVPEISLTPQTVERFVSRFGERIAVLHSHLSEGERHDEWHRVRDGRAPIVIGARSAVFAPVRNLGLIVVDEEHEPSYKQEEAPRYHARDLAVMRGAMEGFAVVLGSATPCLESWHNARTGKYGLARLPVRVDHRRMPAVRVMDMRLETERTGHVSVFSRDLLEAIRLRLERGEQTILFLNRRGYATSLICPRCGYVAACSDCSVSFTYHRKDERLRCHICGAARPVPDRCPGCGDPAFKFTGIGTQRVEKIVTKCFPQAVVQRLDADMTTRKDAYERILGDFRAGKTNILIGTQMVAKGLDFPNVTLVGVIYADLSLHLPDFRAGERTFQLLAQVAGRAGRGDVPGEVIVQTYTPFHPAVQAARRLDYEGFCDQEIEFRRELKYPPFAHLVCLTLRGPSEEKVAFTAAALARALRAALPERVVVARPAPAPLAKAKGRYRYQIMLRSPSVRSLAGPMRETLRGFRMPPKVTCAVDVDALSLL